MRDHHCTLLVGTVVYAPGTMCRTITEIYPNPQLLASAAEAVAGLIKSSSYNLKYCGLTALAAVTR